MHANIAEVEELKHPERMDKLAQVTRQIEDAGERAERWRRRRAMRSRAGH